MIIIALEGLHLPAGARNRNKHHPLFFFKKGRGVARSTSKTQDENDIPKGYRRK